MSDSEALMWAVEKDPALRSDFCNLTVLARPPDPARLRAMVETALDTIERLRQRVVSAPLRLLPPEWVDDPALDLDYHVRRVGVPEPGDERALLDLVAALSEPPFDRSRPLWEFTVIEGLEGGRAALLQKVHHTITDGVGGLRLSLALVSTEPEPEEEAAEPGAVSALSADLAAEERAAAAADPLARFTPLDVMRSTVSDLVARGAGTAGAMLSAAGRLVTHPADVPRRVGRAARVADSLRRQLLVTGRARSDVMTGRSLRRHLEVLSLPLPEARAAAKRLGGSLNDLFVTALTGALATYHRRHGSECDSLRMAMPVNTRDRGETAANRFAPARVVVPLTPDDPAERFHEIHERLAGLRGEAALGVTEGLAAVAAGLPTSLLVALARNQTRTIDFTASNLRGSPVPLYLAGARIEASYPIGPRAGGALNVTLLSLGDEMHLGFNLDPAAVQDPAAFVADVRKAFDDAVGAVL